MNQRPTTPPPQSRRRSLPDRRAGGRRVLAVALLISGLVHVIAIGIVGGLLDRDPDRGPRRPEALVVEPPRGMRVVQLAEPTAPEPEPMEEPEEPEEREEPPEQRDARAPEPVARVETGEPVPADTISAADRLAPRVVDPRLWRPMVLLPREPTLDDVEARVAAAVGLLSDSALAAADAAMRARDWTVEDADGGRWGISPGRLHLGSLTLPLPIWIPVDPEFEASEQRWYELERQLDRQRILESFQDRVRAIRERRDREREEAREAANGGG